MHRLTGVSLRRECPKVDYRALFFLISINDIVIDIQSTIKLFADDTSLYLIIDNPQTTADILNRDLDKIHTWSTNWLVSFSPQKTETMTISRKKQTASS